MGINFFGKIGLNNAKKFYRNLASIENMALYVLVKRDFKEKGAKFVANHYFKSLIELSELDQSKYISPFDEIMNIEGVFVYCLNSLHYSMSNNLNWVGDICDLMINGNANLFYEIPFRRV